MTLLQQQLRILLCLLTVSPTNTLTHTDLTAAVDVTCHKMQTLSHTHTHTHRVDEEKHTSLLWLNLMTRVVSGRMSPFRVQNPLG